MNSYSKKDTKICDINGNDARDAILFLVNFYNNVLVDNNFTCGKNTHLDFGR